MSEDKSRFNVLYLLADRGHDLTINHGYRIHVLRILEGLKKRGHKAFLITINDKKTLPDFTDYRCVPHKYVRVIHKGVPYIGLLDTINILKACLRINRVRHFDIIHERYGLYSYGGWFAAKVLNLPYVLEVNAPIIEEKGLFGLPLKGPQKWSAKMSSWACLRKADHIISVSANLKRYLVDKQGLGETIITVLPNATDTESFGADFNRDEIRSRLGLSTKMVVGFVGTLQMWYGVENLLLAFDEVQRQLPDARLVLIGDGQARRDLEQLANKLNLGSAVRFLGNVEHSRVPEFLSAVDIAVAPFREVRTGFYQSPLKVFEYMAAGKAIVASKIGQIAEVLQDELTALLVKPGDVQELSAAIVRLARDADLRKRIGTAASDEAAKKYSWDNYVSKLEEIYDQAVHQRLWGRKNC